jgi:hypothetical protein
MADNPLDPFEQRLGSLDVAALKRRFEASGEFICVEDFLPSEILAALLRALPALEPHVHRNFIPKHKKGGSVSRFGLDEAAPLFAQLYCSTSFKNFLDELCGRELLFCPQSDPHTYALYYYSEPGDHIGYHYDTSYYRGARYTVLIGLVNDSSCRLEYQLHTRDANRETETASVGLTPGMLVVFNGDKLYHRITPLGENETRIALTMEYLTHAGINPLLRFVSNMKDSIAYFGFKQVFNPRRG